MALISLCGRAVLPNPIRQFAWPELCRPRNRIRFRSSGWLLTSRTCAGRAKKGPSMRFKQSRLAALVVGALICVLSGPVLAQRHQAMTIAFTNANVISLDRNGVEQ